jgi:phosphoserine phosphatase
MAQENTTTWIYLVRHGATDNNLANPPILQGHRTDPALSEQGKEQTVKTGLFLANVELDAVFSSPLLRARQTAEAIAGPHGLEVQTIDDLTEVDVGDWEGYDWDEIAEQWPKEYQAFIEDTGRNPYAGGETFQQVQDRVLVAMADLAENNLGRRIAVAAHNVVNRSFLSALLNIPLKNYRKLPQSNCGINILRYSSNSHGGKWKLVTINGMFHL